MSMSKWATDYILLVLLACTSLSSYSLHHSATVIPAKTTIVTEQNITSILNPTSAKATSTLFVSKPIPEHKKTVIASKPISHTAEINPAPVIFRVHTDQPVVFLTIDDGVVRNPDIPTAFHDNGIKATMFLVLKFVKHDPDYFANIVDQSGSMIEDHTVDHPKMTDLSFEQQKGEICGAADDFQGYFKKRPSLFRPPGGFYNEETQKAVTACGLKQIVMWDVTIDNGNIQYIIGNRLRSGDIVLMHFKSNFAQDFKTFIQAVNASGVRVDLLENYL